MHTRHNLVWLTKRGWDGITCTPSTSSAGAIKLWRTSGWPLIARRADVDTAADQVCVGLALPPDPITRQKIRIPIQADASEVKNVAPPLQLSDVINHAPEGWRRALASLVAEAGESEFIFHTYGSLSLQTLTGLDYVTPFSDIDLLFYPDSPYSLQSGLVLLDRYAEVLPLDGEIVFPNGDAVAWKEWMSATSGKHGERVMVKSDHTVSLMATSELLARFWGTVCAE